MMDPSLEPYWTVEEIAVWARCRDPVVVYLLKTPASDGRHAERNMYLDLRIAGAAMAARGRGRNIERELWEAWGHPTPLSSLVAPYFASDMQRGAESRTSNDFAPEWLALAGAYGKTSLSDQRGVADVLDLAAASRSNFELAAQLPLPFDVLVGNVLATRKDEDSSFGYQPLFPAVGYLLEILRSGRFKAVGNLPNEPLARELSIEDWHGLTIANASDSGRLRVWRLTNTQRFGYGDIENVRVARDAVLKAFPADPPPTPKPVPIHATDEDARRVIRDAMASRDGFIPQKEGARIVRAVYTNFSVERAMELTKELTGNTKPGPRGPRRKLSQ
jgi:hypothetical protein